MKVPTYNISGAKSGETELPAHFAAPVKFALIKRAVLSEQSMRLQPKGSYIWAGLDTSAKYRGRKEAYASLKNQGQPMLPRAVLPKGRSGQVRRIPSSVKGRRAHPPKVEKIIHEKLNKKERRAAIISALAATAQIELAKKRGHNLGSIASLPIVIDNAFESISKTKEVFAILERLIQNDLSRSKDGKKRKTGVARRMSTAVHYPRSALIVVSEKAKVLSSARNIAGIDVCTAKTISTELLAPGTYPGRIAIFTPASLQEISKL